jgi:hypothetical protein
MCAGAQCGFHERNAAGVPRGNCLLCWNFCKASEVVPVIGRTDVRVILHIMMKPCESKSNIFSETYREWSTVHNENSDGDSRSSYVTMPGECL